MKSAGKIAVFSRISRKENKIETVQAIFNTRKFMSNWPSHTFRKMNILFKFQASR